MRHKASVICGRWAIFFATFTVTYLLLPTETILLPLLCSVVTVIATTLLLHTRIRFQRH